MRIGVVLAAAVLGTAVGRFGAPPAALAKGSAPAKPRFVPGEIVSGKAKNGMAWHVRVPKGWTAKRGTPGIVILHGSNMNGKTYVHTLAARWPDLADDYAIVGFDGEQRDPRSTDENPICNFTYVNFAGRSEGRGPPGSERESPALVSEAMDELKDLLGVTRWFVGGHSQGAFLTYSILMNYPEKVAGAFPVSGGLIVQCEPTAYEEKGVRAAQRLVPLAVVHGENDEAVDFGSGLHAWEAFEDAGFPALRLFSHPTAAHMFAVLPVDEAIRWLEAMASTDPAALRDVARRSHGEGRTRDASAAIARARRLDAGGKHRAALDALAQKIDAEAAPLAAELAKAIRADDDEAWVARFHEFRARYGLAPAAEPALDAYARLRARQEEPAADLFRRGQAAMNARDEAGAWKAREELVAKYRASSRWRLVRRWLSQRK